MVEEKQANPVEGKKLLKEGKGEIKVGFILLITVPLFRNNERINTN